MGHGFVGVVEEAGSEVSGVTAGDFVVSPFAWSDNTCDFCREGFQTSCRHGGFYAANGIGGAQAEAIRVPLAAGTRRDGSLSRARTVWIVRVGDELYLRSVNGPAAAWYRSTRTCHQGRIEARDVTWTDVDATGQPAADPAARESLVIGSL